MQHTTSHDLIVESTGTVRCVYADGLPLSHLGRLHIQRASHVEPTEDGHWTADLQPVGGPTLGPFAKRQAALAAEIAWLNQQWLCPN